MLDSQTKSPPADDSLVQRHCCICSKLRGDCWLWEAWNSLSCASSSECQQTTLLPLSKLSILWPLSCSQLADYTSSGDPSQHYSTFSSDHLWSAGQQPVGSQKDVLGDESPPFPPDNPSSADVFLGSTIPLCLHRPCNIALCSSCCPNEIRTRDYPKTFCDKPL